MPPEDTQRAKGEIARPMFGYKNYIGIDRAYGFVRRFVVSHVARHDGSLLGAVLDAGNIASDAWADAAYRSKAAGSGAPSRAGSRCHLTSPAATPPCTARGC